MKMTRSPRYKFCCRFPFLNRPWTRRAYQWRTEGGRGEDSEKGGKMGKKKKLKKEKRNKGKRERKK